MADQKQLDLLLQGVQGWNRWRNQHPEIRLDLNHTDLSGADLSFADFSRANLSFADFSFATLSGATLSGANLSGARVGDTVFGNVDLQTVKGLETVEHWAPSTIGTDTLLRSEGKIPETFMRQAGLTDIFITSVRSLAQNPIEYYTCFISYSSKNQEFAERLYSDLQSNNVRCWFAPEDLKIGEKFWQRIDESIRLYDKLLVVLSQYSVNSTWVENEVMAALEKEEEHHKLVLFPIKLDEMIMHTNLPWATSIRRTRHIGDFTHWKDHDAYQKSLKRLLRDLQPSTPTARTSEQNRKQRPNKSNNSVETANFTSENIPTKNQPTRNVF